MENQINRGTVMRGRVTQLYKALPLFLEKIYSQKNGIGVEGSSTETQYPLYPYFMKIHMHKNRNKGTAEKSNYKQGTHMK
jgi:hypothetical protein